MTFALLHGHHHAACLFGQGATSSLHFAMHWIILPLGATLASALKIMAANIYADLPRHEVAWFGGIPYLAARDFARTAIPNGQAFNAHGALYHF